MTGALIDNRAGPGSTERRRAIASTRRPRTFARSRRCPLRRQIAARLAAEIRDGRLPAGRRLPGIRRMADRLGVHRHTVTAAYGELRRVGLLRTVPGHGTFVARHPGPRGDRGPPRGEAWDGGGGLRGLLVRERAAGRSAAEVGRLLRAWDRARAGARLAVADPDAGLRAAVAREVRAATGLEARALSPDRIPAADRASRGGDAAPPLWAAVLARRRHLEALAERCPPWTEVVPLPLAGGLDALSRVRALPATSVVALVTGSPWVRRHYRALLAGELGRGIALVRPDPGDARALRRARRIATLLLADASCLELPELAGCRRVEDLPLLRRGPLRALAGWLAPDAPEVAGEGGSDG